MDVFVARQPIFDTQKELFAYEFLFRDGLSNAFPDIDGETATSRLLSESFFNMDVRQLSGNRKVFVNFTRDLLIRRIPALFSADDMVVEILEDVEPEEDLIKACREIAAKGFTIALDDFLFRPELKPLIELAHIIKVDLRQTPVAKAEKLIQALGKGRLTFLAEKIETHEEFEKALAMGFSLFQGYFFSKPEIVQGKDIKPAKLTLLQLVHETSLPDWRMDDLDQLINRDVSISYKLLRYINSAFFRRRVEITSIRHAIALLGERELKQFIALVATAELARDKPQELVRSAIIRARFCELIGYQSQLGIDPSELFLMGLFSQIDAMLDADIETVMATLPLADRIKDALIAGTGKLADILGIVIAYESGDWHSCTRRINATDIDHRTVPGHYLDAVGWADAYSNMSPKS